MCNDIFVRNKCESDSDQHGVKLCRVAIPLLSALVCLVEQRRQQQIKTPIDVALRRGQGSSGAHALGHLLQCRGVNACHLCEARSSVWSQANLMSDFAMLT